jgi:hypothetical protein
MKKKKDEENKLKKISYILLLFSFLIPFLFYFFSLYRDIVFFDAGEFIIASYTLGITHPTGYPLYVILSYPFVHLFSNPVFGSSLLSALFLSVACIFIYLFTSSFTSYYFEKAKNSYFISFALALFVASDMLIWHWSIQPEVYSLNILLISVASYLFLRVLNYKKNEKLFFFFLALGLSNHRTFIYYFLIFIIIIVLTKKYKILFDQKNILSFVAGFSPYFFMFIQANFHPFLNWGNPSNLNYFLKHISAWQYKAIFGISEHTKFHIKYLFSSLPEDIFIPILFLIVLGILTSIFSKNWKIFLALFFICFLSLFQVLYYNIGDIEPYYINFHLPLLLFSVFFMFYFSKILKKFNFLFILFGIIAFFINFPKLDGSKFFFTRNFINNTILNMPKNSVLISSKGSIFYFPFLYMQVIEKERKDIIYIDSELLKLSWYVDFLKNLYPDFFKGLEEDFSNYEEILKKNEKGKVAIEDLKKSYLKIIDKIVNKCWENNFYVFVGHEFVRKGYADNYFPVPSGLFFEIQKTKGCYNAYMSLSEDFVPKSYPLKQKFIIYDIIKLNEQMKYFRKKYEDTFCN